MFYDRFIELCKKKGVRPSAVAKEIGLSNAAPTYWKNGSIPKSSTIQAIADYFGVTAGYLLGDENIRLVPLFEGAGGINLDDVDIAFYGGYKELSESDKEILRDMVRVMLERRKNPPQD